MKNRVFADIATYLEAVSEQLNSESRQAGLLENTSVVGGDREEIYRRFLERHLPRSCEVFRGGYVFDIEGRASWQIDVIVASGGSPRFEMGSGRLAIATIEGTAAIAEIKSKLDKVELVKSLDALQELPSIGTGAGSPSPSLRVTDERRWDLPYKILFAYDGIDKDTLYAHLVEYYRRNPHVPNECRPSLVHVLGKYALFRIVPGMTVLETDGTKAQQQPGVGDYWLFSRKSDLFAMMFMLTTIQSNLFLANHTIANYDRYINEIGQFVLQQPWRR